MSKCLLTFVIMPWGAMYPGQPVDADQESAVQSAGAVLGDLSDANIAAASAQCEQMRFAGKSESDTLSALMQSAVNATQTTAIAADASLMTTSTSSNALANSGAKTFGISAGLAFIGGQRLRVWHDSTHYMEGTVTSYSATTLVVAVDHNVGTGTFTSWNISVAGEMGMDGIDGTNGAPGYVGTPGIGTLNGSGVATISDAAITATSVIMVSGDDATGILTKVRNNGSGFTVTSSVGATDSGKKFSYAIIKYT